MMILVIGGMLFATCLQGQHNFSDCEQRLLDIVKTTNANESFAEGIKELDALLIDCQEGLRQHDTTLALIYHRRGIFHYSLREYEEAIQDAKQAVAIRKTLTPPDPILMGRSHLNLAIYFEFSDQTNLAKIQLDTAISVLVSAQKQDHSLMGDVQSRMASLLAEDQDFEAAIDYIYAALSEYQQVERPEKIAFAHFQLGGFLSQLNRKAEGEHHFRQAISFYKSLNPITLFDWVNIAHSHNNLGELAYMNGKLPEAISQYQSAIGIYSRPELSAYFQADLIDIHSSLAKAQNAKGDLMEAHASLDQAKGIALDLHGKETHPAFARIYDLRGDIVLKEGQTQQALAYYQQAIQQVIPDFSPQDDLKSPNITDTTFIFDSKSNLLTYFRSKAKTHQLLTSSKQADDPHLQAALKLYLQADKLIHRMRKEHLNDGSKLFWIAQSRPIYEEAIDLCHRIGNIEQAYSFAEKSMASLLLAELNNLNAKNVAGISEKKLREERKLKQYVRESEILLEKAQLDSTQTSNIPQLQQTLSKARIDFQNFVKELEQAFPYYVEQKYKDELVSIPEIQAHLKQVSEQASEATAFLQYFSGDSDLFLFYILPDTAYLWKMDQPYVVAQSFFRVISDTADITDAYNRQSLNLVSHGMYRALFEPILASEIDLPRRLTIIPDGYVAQVPFEALIKNPTDDPKGKIPFFVWDHMCQYGSSATTLLRERSRVNEAEDGVLAVAPVKFDRYPKLSGLLFSEFEVQKIVETIDGKALLHGAATKANVLEQLSRYRILHFSTHAVASSTPYIVFGDTLLFLPEIYGLQTSADMVVLSACETFQGDQIKGEGFMSLARAFQYIGVPSITATLWSVSDRSTQLIMSSYYEHLATGLQKDEALYNAKIDYLESQMEKQNRYAQAPFFWAPLITVGDNSPVVESYSAKRWTYGLLLLMALLLGIIIMRKRKKRHLSASR